MCLFSLLLQTLSNLGILEALEILLVSSFSGFCNDDDDDGDDDDDDDDMQMYLACLVVTGCCQFFHHYTLCMYQGCKNRPGPFPGRML